MDMADRTDQKHRCANRSGLTALAASRPARIMFSEMVYELGEL